uniref:HTH psq-type domain-containing protein n=1 Tax=Hyaloperonospora arabidopsidis (strain Emoy2) TaxID=559515 RepID=M4BBS1_HYAAE
MYPSDSSITSSDRIGNSLFSRVLDPSSKSLVDSSDYRMPLYSRQPLQSANHRRHLLNTGIPNQGYANKLPGVATLLRRHDTAQAMDSAPYVPPISYGSQRSRIETGLSGASECWTPPHSVGRPQTITFPAFKWVPLTASLTPVHDYRIDDRNRHCDKFVATPTSDLRKSQPDDTDMFLLSSDIRSPEPAWKYSDLQPKSSRYLREIDRRRILMRIAQGEKQSALAKEYHVSRAAICNLNKHRAEVLSRNYEHPLAKHPKRRMVVKMQPQDMGDNQWSDASN